MKRTITLLTVLLCLSSCAQPKTYTKTAYYAHDFVYTEDGYLYHYPMDIPDNTYVIVTFDANSTADFIDDRIINIEQGEM